MEALLRELKDYGLNNLSFMIVNSKEPRSLMMINELQDKVSFPVHQETPEEEVWNTMEGRKDDMYVYDKCGRLTYYIPFPLSIIHEEQPIVKAALFSTYYQSPCGAVCSTNATFLIDLVDEHKTQSEPHDHQHHAADAHASNETKQDGETSVTPNEVFTADYYDTLSNFSWDGNNETINSGLMKKSHSLNGTENQNFTQIHNETVDESLFRSVLYFFGWPKKTEKPSAAENEKELINSDGNYTELSKTNETTVETSRDSQTHRLNTNDTNENGIQPESKASNKSAKACQGVDDDVCGDWSKRRLFQAQRCCSSRTDSSLENQQLHYPRCKNFGRKRCKKIHTIIKCCLKTHLFSQFPSKEESEDIKPKSEENM